MPASDASPTAEFQALLEQLKAAGLSAYEAPRDGTRPTPFLPPGDGDPTDPQKLREAFARPTANEKAETALREGGTYGDLSGRRLEIDYMAQAERAAQLAALTPPRAAAHAAGRQGALARADGPLTDVLTIVQRVLAESKPGGAIQDLPDPADITNIT